jgi:hypothetical protein
MLQAASVWPASLQHLAQEARVALSLQQEQQQEHSSLRRPPAVAAAAAARPS